MEMLSSVVGCLFFNIYFFFISICSFDAILNVIDNSSKQCVPLYMYVVLLFLLCNK